MEQVGYTTMKLLWKLKKRIRKFEIHPREKDEDVLERIVIIAEKEKEDSKKNET